MKDFWSLLRSSGGSKKQWKLAELFYVLRSLMFKIVGRSHQWFLYLRMARSVTENSKINDFIASFEKYRLLSNFQYGFRYSRSTADLVTVVSDRIAWAFNRSEATWAVAFDIFMAFGRVCQVCYTKSSLWNLRSVIWPYFFITQ